jgi:(p)ppGpp synthase/HD superfamily hydrolase
MTGDQVNFGVPSIGISILTNKFTLALDYATIVHAGQVRKGTNIPYVSHLLAVASLILEYGGDEEQAIAGLLHDAAEDQGGEPRLADIRVRFGERVADIVRQCSDSLTADANAKAPWIERKRMYLEHLRQSSGHGYLLVSCADKLHNARAILQDFRTVGDRVWKRFTKKGDKTPEELVGLYDALAEALQNRLPGSIANELRATVNQLIAESGLKPDRVGSVIST